MVRSWLRAVPGTEDRARGGNISSVPGRPRKGVALRKHDDGDLSTHSVDWISCLVAECKPKERPNDIYVSQILNSRSTVSLAQSRIGSLPLSEMSNAPLPWQPSQPVLQPPLGLVPSLPPPLSSSLPQAKQRNHRRPGWELGDYTEQEITFS